MMLVDAETGRKLRETGADDLVEALRAQDDDMCAGLTFSERIQMAAGEAHSTFISQKVRNLTKRAGLRYPEADVRSIGFSEKRGLDRLKVTELSTCGFVERGTNVVVQGPAGTGKTYLACALAKAACAKRMHACYVRQPDLEDLWRDSRTRQGGERKLLRKFGGYGPLVLDRLLHAVQVEGAARQAGWRGSCESDHGQDLLRHRLAGDGRRQHARHIRLTVLNGRRRYRFTILSVLSRNIRGAEARKYSVFTRNQSSH